MKNLSSKFKEKGKQLGLSENAAYVLTTLRSEIEETKNLLNRSNLKFAGRHTTVGGSSTEEIEIIGVRQGMHAAAVIHTEGISPVTVKTVKCDFNKIIVEFSADPSTDHKLTYMVCL